MRHSLILTLLLAACSGGDDALRPPPAPADASPADASPAAPPPVTTPPEAHSAPPRHNTRGLDLRLPSIGTAQADLFTAQPDCAAAWDPDARQCRFHGAIQGLPGTPICEDGCTWWTYTIIDGRLSDAVLERSLVDVDAPWFQGFAAEADAIARSLERKLGATAVTDAGDWATVEASPDGTDTLIASRTWRRSGQHTQWTLRGVSGHHPQALLRVHRRALTPR